MRVLYFILVLFIMSIFLVSCGDDDNPVGTGTPGQMVLAWIYFDAYQNDTTIVADGVVMGDPQPAFEYAQFGDTTYSGPDVFDNDFGYFWFEAGPIKTMLDPANLTIKTSKGSVSGSVSYPGNVTNVSFSTTSLALGDTLTITFSSGSNLVGVNAYCEWYDGQNNYHYLSMDTVTSGSSLKLTFPFIPQGGHYYVYNVSALNGPPSIPGARANMTGDGLGFMVYFGESYYVGQDVSIGSGYPSPRPSDSNTSMKERRRRLQEKTAEMYGFSLN